MSVWWMDELLFEWFYTVLFSLQWKLIKLDAFFHMISLRIMYTFVPRLKFNACEWNIYIEDSGSRVQAVVA